MCVYIYIYICVCVCVCELTLHTKWVIFGGIFGILAVFKNLYLVLYLFHSVWWNPERCVAEPWLRNNGVVTQLDTE